MIKSGGVVASIDSKPLPPAKRRKCKLGYFLFDVLNITYLGNDEVDPKKQIGTIKLVTGRGLQYLYKVDEVDIYKPSIKQGDIIPLIVKGPTPTMYDDFVYLDFDLFCGAYKGIHQIKWYPFQREVSRMHVLFQSVDGTGGILVNIACFSNASITNVKVKVINNSTATNVCGLVFAANSELDLADCANVLFLKNHEDAIIPGPGGVIPLSKSFVGVPVDCQLSVKVCLIVNGDLLTSIVKFDPIEEGVVEKFIPNEKEAKIQIKVTWGVEVDEAPIYEIDFIRQRKIKFWSADGKSFMVEEAVALEFHPLRDFIKETPVGKFEYRFVGITSKILLEVIQYFRDRVCRSFSTFYDVKFFIQHDLVTLFNLIQAAHHLHDKSLMDLTCRAFANNVKRLKTKTYGEVRKMLNIDDASIQILTRTYSVEDVPAIDSILRQPGKDTFINKMFSVDVPISSLAIKHLYLFKNENPIFRQCLCNFLESMDPLNSDLKKLLEATRCLHDLIDQDAWLVDSLSIDDVEHLLRILNGIDNSKDMGHVIVGIQSLAVRILSRVLSDSRFYKFSLSAAPDLVKLLSNPSEDVRVAGMIALTRLAFACDECNVVILESGALEIAHEIVLENSMSSDLNQWLAKFLEVICSRGLSFDKTKVVLSISEDLLGKYSYRDRHIVSICYALHYLTDGRHARESIEIEGGTWNKLIKILVRWICKSIEPLCYTHIGVPIVYETIVTAGAALGVVGNIARWGPPDQIQTLANESLLLSCLRRMLCFESKFAKEACRIISNIAARCQTWTQDMHSDKLTKTLCSLLENDMYESDVKMEAAWALFNGIYGDRCQKIDNYPINIDTKEIAIRFRVPKMEDPQPVMV